ncbi:MAG: outer membrane lipoprotein carrier protein LolA [Nitrospirae bacterium]|nr:outer membrane lipoprotein carrier protein LolA [Nitrospirota bacterium]
MIGRAVRVVVFALSGIMALGAAAPSTPDDVVAGVRDTYGALSDLSAEFTQTTTVSGFSTTLVSKGRVYLAKGKMRWDYTEPSNQQIYVNDGRVQYYIPAHKQVIVSTLSPDADDQLPLHLLMTLDRLDAQFAVTWEDPAVPRRDGAYRLRLEPKHPVADLEYVTVGIDPQRRVVTAIALHPKNGNVSSFVFSRLVVNPRLEASLFSFSVPEGIEVVETPTLR